MFNFFSESDVIVLSLLLLVDVNIICKDLMSLFGKINSHGETHVTQTDKADFSKTESISDDKIHFFYSELIITIMCNLDILYATLVI